MPEFWYDNKKHRYYPDFYVPKDNLIIEVKSGYTLNKNRKRNDMKFESVKNAGYNFKLMIIGD